MAKRNSVMMRVHPTFKIEIDKLFPYTSKPMVTKKIATRLRELKINEIF